MRIFVSFSMLLMCLFGACLDLHAQEKPSKPSAAANSVDPELQDFIRQYLVAYAQKDVPKALEYWSVASPNLDGRRKQINELFASASSISLTNVLSETQDSGAASARL